MTAPEIHAARRRAGALLLALALAVASSPIAAGVSPPPPASPSTPASPTDVAAAPATTTGDDAPARPTLADAPELERQTLDELLRSARWARRAVAAMRLQRYGCDTSREHLESMLDSPDWQLRCFALHTLALRGAALPDGYLDREENPRVVRTALRCRYPVDPARLANGINHLRRSPDLQLRLLGVELAAASGDPDLVERAVDDLRTIVVRMGRAEAGVLSARLAALTGAPDQRRRQRWQDWFRRNHTTLTLQPVHLVPENLAVAPESAIARLPMDSLASLAEYMDLLGGRTIDLAIVLDCTASMWGELAQAQGGIDELMLFVGGVARGMRVGIVAFRDRNDREFETRGWEFTHRVDTARERLWSLSADGGGDRREAVYPALKLAYTGLAWEPEHARVLILVGDAPPHVGYGGYSIALARAGAEVGLTTHVIQARLGRDREGRRTEDVQHFPEIATAGNGRCVSMENGTSLIAEIAGLTIGDRFGEELGEYFELYLAMCR